MAQQTVTIVVTDEMMRKVKALAARKDQTIEEVVAEQFETGVKDTCYRIARNQKVYQQKKAEQERMRKVEEKLAELGVSVDEL